MRKLKNSQLFMIGLVIIVIAILILSYNYLLDKKKTVYTKMSIKLYESEVSENIEKEETEKVENDNVEAINQVQVVENKNHENQNKISFEYIGLIEIPKINLKKGFLDPSSSYNKVDYNVTVINTSLFPDVDLGNFILAAHSGNAYNSYFGKLYKLKKGDVAYIYYKGIKYEYKIVNIYEVPKTGEVNIYRNFDATTLTLITCTLNSNTKQTVYIAELYKKSKY